MAPPSAAAAPPAAADALSRLVVERVPPQSAEAEQSVLGAMLLDSDVSVRAIEILGTGGFYREAHQKVYEAILSLSERDEPADLTTVSEELRRKGGLEAAGGHAYLAELVTRTPTSAHVEHYARIVKDKSVRRGLISAATSLASEAFEEGEPTDELLDRAEARIFELAARGQRRDFVRLSDAAHASISHIEKLYERKGLVTGVATGFPDLDQWTAGFQPSDLVVVAARPGMGKSAFVLNVATHAAVVQKLHVAFFSLEMSAEQLVLRMLCSESRINLHHVRTGHLDKKDWTRLILAAGSLAEAPIYVDDSSSLSVLELRAKSRRLRAEGKLGMVIVDYLQLLRGRGRVENRQQEVAEISRSLKALAKELEVPVIAVSQLSRAAEGKDEDRPRLAHLRESGAIEQDADLVLFIVRDVSKRDGANANLAELHIAKQRNGPAGESVQVYWNAKYTRFDRLDTVHAGPADAAPAAPAAWS